MNPESKGPFNQEIIKPASKLEDKYFNDEQLNQINSELREATDELETLQADEDTDSQNVARKAILTNRINTLVLLKEERRQAIRKSVMGAMGETYTIKQSEDPWEAGRGFDASRDKRGTRG